jgi:hypothetical protein
VFRVFPVPFSFAGPIDAGAGLEFHSGMDQQGERGEQNEAVVTTRRIKERLKALHEKASELDQTLERVKRNLQANESKETNR